MFWRESSTWKRYASEGWAAIGRTRNWHRSEVVATATWFSYGVTGVNESLRKRNVQLNGKTLPLAMYDLTDIIMMYVNSKIKLLIRKQHWQRMIWNNAIADVVCRWWRHRMTFDDLHMLFGLAPRRSGFTLSSQGYWDVTSWSDVNV